jgi:ATP-dependent exoDNAse (exonuclease V) alpha subunit
MDIKGKLSIYDTDDYKSLLIEQKIGLLAAMQGDNILVTGGGGVGKSHLIKIIEKNITGIVLTATTGIASINIGGQTLSRFMGLGSNTISVSQARKIRKDVLPRLEAVKVLLIDEASMLRVDTFECLNARLQSAKKNKKPFGGVQMIFVGDFCQLNPIIGKNLTEKKVFHDSYGQRLYCFESDLWEESNIIPYVLTEYIRQGSQVQRKVLRHIRMGKKLKECVSIINELAKGNVSNQALHVVTTNAHVEKINDDSYGKLLGEKTTYFGKIKGDFNDIPVAEAINLKVGCRVMICANNADADYYNGDIGTITALTLKVVTVSLDRGNTVSVVPFEWDSFSYEVSGKDLKKISVGEFSQIPIKLAYAVTIHKSQGMTLDEIVIDFTGGGVSRAGTFAEGQAYVALSRVRSFEKLKLMVPLKVSDIKFNGKATQFTMQTSTLALSRRHLDLDRFKVVDIAA